MVMAVDEELRERLELVADTFLSVSAPVQHALPVDEWLEIDRYALALTRSGADAEDLVQDAVLRAYRHWEGLRQAAKPWLMAIVRNCFFTGQNV